MRVSLILSIAVCFMLLGGESIFAQTGKDKATLTSVSETEQSAITFDELDEFVVLIENRQVRIDLTLQPKLQAGTNMLLENLNEDSPKKWVQLIGRIFSINNGDSGTVENGITTTFSPGIAILEALEKSPPPDMLPYLGRVYVDNATSIGGANRPTMKRLAVFLQNTVGELPATYHRNTCEKVIPMGFQVHIAERLLAEKHRRIDALVAKVSQVDFTKLSSPDNDWGRASTAIKEAYQMADPYAIARVAPIIERLFKNGSTEEKENREKHAYRDINHHILDLRRSFQDLSNATELSEKRRTDRAMRIVKNFVQEVVYLRTDSPAEFEEFSMPGAMFDLEMEGWGYAELSIFLGMFHAAQRELDGFLVQSPPTPYSQWQAVRLMGKMLDINTTPTLISIVEAPDVCPLTMREVMLALGKIGGSGVQEYLWKVLQRPLPDTVDPERWSDPEIERRASAAEALGYGADRENYKEVFSKLGKVSMGSSAISRGSAKGRRIIGQRFGMPHY